MPIPDYQSAMLPLLKLASDRKEHRLRDACKTLADTFGLSEDERQELVPSGSQTIIHNRVSWAKTYLYKAGLLGSPRRAIFNITQRGLDFLAENPPEIKVSMLNRYEEFVKFRTAKPGKKPGNEGKKQDEDNGDSLDKQTPDDLLEQAYSEIRDSLADDLLDQVKKGTPVFFERLVVELLESMGYGGSIEGAGKVVGRTGDEGIDGMIKEDRLGLDVIYLQAKRWKDTVVRRGDISQFVGDLQGKRAKKGIFITTSTFDDKARKYAETVESNIVLIDGKQLAQYMIDFDLGVSTINTYKTKRIDSDYFEED